MLVIENAHVVCRSLGEKNVVVVENTNTGENVTLHNSKGIELELGMEGRLIYNEGTLVSFEPAMVEELA
jgi:hypothetical protein